jgi:hypothetical protein
VCTVQWSFFVRSIIFIIVHSFSLCPDVFYIEVDLYSNVLRVMHNTSWWAQSKDRSRPTPYSFIHGSILSETPKSIVICCTHSFDVIMQYFHNSNIKWGHWLSWLKFSLVLLSLLAYTRMGPQLGHNHFHILSDSSVILPFDTI